MGWIVQPNFAARPLCAKQVMETVTTNTTARPSGVEPTTATEQETGIGNLMMIVAIEGLVPCQGHGEVIKKVGSCGAKGTAMI